MYNVSFVVCSGRRTDHKYTIRSHNFNVNGEFLRMNVCCFIDGARSDVQKDCEPFRQLLSHSLICVRQTRPMRCEPGVVDRIRMRSV